jgi:uncharacterized protein YllA (UPF0747 family)
MNEEVQEFLDEVRAARADPRWQKIADDLEAVFLHMHADENSIEVFDEVRRITGRRHLSITDRFLALYHFMECHS